MLQIKYAVRPELSTFNLDCSKQNDRRNLHVECLSRDVKIVGIFSNAINHFASLEDDLDFACDCFIASLIQQLTLNADFYFS